MKPDKTLRGKRVLVVDDEEDILSFLTELLDMCKVDAAKTFEEAKELLETRYYDFAVLDIMGVRGYDLLEIAKGRDVPALMLTAHALSRDNLKQSFEKGAAYYVPKEKIGKVDLFLSDILEAREKNLNVWAKWSERLGDYCNRRFENWKEEDPEFWDKLLKY